MLATIILVVVIATLISHFSVEGFSRHHPIILKAAHTKSQALNVVLNPKNRGNKKFESPLTNMKRRDPKTSTRKQLSSFFGFTSTAELLNGRLAMSFFLLGIYEEIKTGKSMLQQVGLVNQNQQINGFMVAALFGSMALYPSISKWFTKLSSIRLKNPSE